MTNESSGEIVTCSEVWIQGGRLAGCPKPAPYPYDHLCEYHRYHRDRNVPRERAAVAVSAAAAAHTVMKPVTQIPAFAGMTVGLMK